MGYAHISTLVSSSKERVEKIQNFTNCEQDLNEDKHVDMTDDNENQSPELKPSNKPTRSHCKSYLQALTSNLHGGKRDSSKNLT